MVLRLNSSKTADLAGFSQGVDPAPGPLELPGDRKIEQAIQTGMRSLTDPGFLIPMGVAQGVFGYSRLGLLRLVPREGSKVGALVEANLGAFGLEGLAFVGSARGLDLIMGRKAVPGTNFVKEMGHAYLTMGLLKTFGAAAKAFLQLRWNNLPVPWLTLQDKMILTAVPQAAQFAGIYLSHTLAPGLGLGSYMDPAERAWQSAVTLVHFGAAGYLLNRLPGYAQANRNIHRESQKIIQENWNLLAGGDKGRVVFPIPALAAAGRAGIGREPLGASVLGKNEMWMSASNNNGAGKGEGPHESPHPDSDSIRPSETTLVRRPSRSKGSYIDLTLEDLTEVAPDSDPLVGQTIDGRYYVESVLGEGGMGRVYKARHTHLDKNVAIKVLRYDLPRREEMSSRFIKEAKAASMIDNPHIIDVNDFGELDNGSTYFVMEYLDGRSLGQLIVPDQPLPLPQLLNVSLQMTEGMAAAHDVNIIHRDLKPDNIFLSRRGSDPAFVKILDFGIAKFPTGTKLTLAGEVFGTPEYLSPEQARGDKVDHRSDIYSAGIILYEMATGKVPFESANYAIVLNQHLTQEPIPPSHLVSDPKAFPPGLEAVILKCLRKEPADRYQNMQELHDDLLRIQEGLKPMAVPSLWESLRPQAIVSRGWVTDWRLWAGLFGTAVAGGGALLLLRKENGTDHPPLPPVPPPTPKKPEPAAPPPPPPAAETKIPPPVTAKQVQISVLPADAHFFMGDLDLGKGEVSLEIPAGEKVEVELRRRGYHSEKLILDGSKAEISVKLKAHHRRAPAAKPRAGDKPEPATRPSPSPTPAPKPKPAPPPKAEPRKPIDVGTIHPW